MNERALPPVKGGHGGVVAMGPDDEDIDPTPLRDLDFTDLYLDEGGAAFMRGIVDKKEPIFVVPDGAISDIDKIHKRVCALGQTQREFVVDHDGIRYRVSKIESEGSAWYALRRALFPIPRLAHLGIQPMIYRELGRAAKRPNRGLILLAGSTGAGKTTTVCSILQEYLMQLGDVAITIEDPPELKMEGRYNGIGHCFQTKVQNGDFATPLRAALRYNPRYILLGEIRDPEAASEALRAAVSGHVVLATVHGGSIEEAITSVLKLVSARLDLDLARNMLADGLAAVIHQELRRMEAADGRSQRRIVARSLFFGNDKGLRSKVREGKIQLLGTEIEAQAARVSRGESPLAKTNGRG